MSRKHIHGDRNRNTDNSGDRRSFAYEQAKDLPGVGGDLVTQSLINGGMALVGWDERRECWERPDCGVSIGIEVCGGGYVVVNVASNVDPAMAGMIDDFAAKGRILAGAVRVGVRPKTDSDNAHLQGKSGPLSLTLPPSASDKKRKFAKHERNQGGRHAGKPQIVFKPKAMTLSGFVDLVKLIHPMVKADWFVGETTQSMYKNGDMRVIYTPDGKEQAKKLARFSFFTVVPRSCSLDEALEEE